MQQPEPSTVSGVTAPDDALLDCLHSLTVYFQRPQSRASLIAGLPLSNHKLSPDLFSRAAKKAALSSKLHQLNLAEVTPLHLPAVLLLNSDQAVVLIDIDYKQRCTILDPASNGGKKVLPLKELQELYLGTLITVQEQYRFDSRSDILPKHRPKHWFWGIVWQAIPIYGEVLIASFLINLFALASPLFVMNVYDRVVPNNAIETLWVLAIGVLIVFSFDFIMRSLRGYFVDHASKKVDVKLSALIYEQIMGINMASRPSSVGSLSNTVTSFESFRDFITSTTINVVVDLPFSLLFIAVIALLGGSLAFIPLIAIPVIIGVGLLVQIPLSKLVQRSYRLSAEKQAALLESLSGIETVKSFAAEGQMQSRWERVVASAAQLGAKIRTLSNFGVNFSLFAQHFTSVIVVIFGVYKISEGDMTMGALIACTILTGRALAPMAQAAGIITRYQQAVTSLHAVNSVMAMPLEQAHDSHPLAHHQFSGAMEIKNLTFNYPDEPVSALQDINLTIKPGERVGIIGRIGSGKSTLGKLLLGLYKPSQGNIMFDGLELGHLDKTDLRHNIGYVPQDVVLFHGTVRDNILMTAPFADDDAMIRAANLSGASDFIARHPKGFDLLIQEGGKNLSGGQRQSIAISRALLRNPNILILDEPTNSMDDRSEAHFKQQLSENLDGKTLILITHRGSMLNLVDRLIIFDQGKIVADGPKQAVLTALKSGDVNTPKKGA